ncbi:hypothetical protein FOYG_17185 [Fusarium oxysporum NRRL 32931]|uniref:Uncharacterized protein n=1 Tax=Fusarium oxysporum NRRL 32931 TaxID=660029 RepID=W9HFD4_FUSOX|nr:hypothetical protein FOYG_17185 [Fusarium oxysporum NRRL 32931]
MQAEGMMILLSSPSSLAIEKTGYPTTTSWLIKITPRLCATSTIHFSWRSAGKEISVTLSFLIRGLSDAAKSKKAKPNIKEKKTTPPHTLRLKIRSISYAPKSLSSVIVITARWKMGCHHIYAHRLREPARPSLCTGQILCNLAQRAFVTVVVVVRYEVLEHCHLRGWHGPSWKKSGAFRVLSLQAQMEMRRISRGEIRGKKMEILIGAEEEMRISGLHS